VRRYRWRALLALSASLLGACGGDGESSTDKVTTAPLTVPEDNSGPSSSTDTTDTTSTDTTSTDTAPGAPDAPLDQPNPGNGGATAPDNNGGSSAPQDTPSNDTPPKPGSPADRFEQFCAQNPGAC
jgi:hypothetical protein